jgi:MoaD family protein
VTSVLQKVVGAKSVQSEGKTVGEVLDGINSQYPGFREQITQEDGSLHRFVNIYINDEDIRFLQSLDTPVSEGDVLSILPALAGGSGVSPGFVTEQDAPVLPFSGGAGVSPDLQLW